MAVVRWDPFRELGMLQDRMNRLFDDAGRGWRADEPAGGRLGRCPARRDRLGPRSLRLGLDLGRPCRLAIRPWLAPPERERRASRSHPSARAPVGPGNRLA